MTSYDLSFR